MGDTALCINIVRDHINKSVVEFVALEALKIELLKYSKLVHELEMGRLIILRCESLSVSKIENISFHVDTVERAKKIVSIKLMEKQYIPLEYLEEGVITTLYENEEVMSFDLSGLNAELIVKIIKEWWTFNSIIIKLEDNKQAEVIISKNQNDLLNKKCLEYKEKQLYPPIASGITYALVVPSQSFLGEKFPVLQIYANSLSKYINNPYQFAQYRPLVGGGYFGIIGMCSSTNLKSSLNDARKLMSILSITKEEFECALRGVVSNIQYMRNDDLLITQLVTLNYLYTGHTDYSAFFDRFLNVKYADFLEFMFEHSKKEPTLIVTGLVSSSWLDKIMEESYAKTYEGI